MKFPQGSDWSSRRSARGLVSVLATLVLVASLISPIALPVSSGNVVSALGPLDLEHSREQDDEAGVDPSPTPEATVEENEPADPSFDPEPSHFNERLERPETIQQAETTDEFITAQQVSVTFEGLISTVAEPSVGTRYFANTNPSYPGAVIIPAGLTTIFPGVRVIAPEGATPGTSVTFQQFTERACAGDVNSFSSGNLRDYEFGRGAVALFQSSIDPSAIQSVRMSYGGDANYSSATICFDVIRMSDTSLTVGQVSGAVVGDSITVPGTLSSSGGLGFGNLRVDWEICGPVPGNLRLAGCGDESWRFVESVSAFSGGETTLDVSLQTIAPD